MDGGWRARSSVSKANSLQVPRPFQRRASHSNTHELGTQPVRAEQLELETVTMGIHLRTLHPATYHLTGATTRRREIRLAGTPRIAPTNIVPASSRVAAGDCRWLRRSRHIAPRSTRSLHLLLDRRSDFRPLNRSTTRSPVTECGTTALVVSALAHIYGWEIATVSARAVGRARHV